VNAGPNLSPRRRRPLVALATSAAWPDLAPDDRLIAPALGRVGVDAEVVVWTDQRTDWDLYDLIVVRSCWDYHDDLRRWLDWIGTVDQPGSNPGQNPRPNPRPRLLNPAPVLRWNAKKTYLLDLAARGVPIVPTLWLDGPDLLSSSALTRALLSTGWQDLICKPAVSAGALCTHRLRMQTLSQWDAVLAVALPELARRGPVLVQPFLPQIVTEGEWSLLFFDGRLSHAVLKRPALGDFRVQEKHGGATIAAVPPQPLVDLARQVLAAAAQVTVRETTGETSPPDHIPAPLPYARVDLVESAGKPLLIELEVTEPALFLGTASAPSSQDSAADRFATAIAARLPAHHELTAR
jgi:hypothetical protein